MDNQLLQQLFKRYGREIYLYLYSLCHNQSVAEDLLQETFLKAILSLKDNHSNMRAWLYMVSRNLLFNYLKKEKNVLLVAGLHDLPGNQFDLEEKKEPLDEILISERKRVLYQALYKLSSQKREILIMQYFGGLTQKEIAAIMHVTPENVRVLSFRAKKELKAYMEEKGYDLP